MGRIWLAMIVVVVVGCVLTIAVGLGRAAYIPTVGVLVVLRSLWYRVNGGYREAMSRAGLVPHSQLDWALMRESMARVGDPRRPVTRGAEPNRGLIGIVTWLCAAPLGLGAWVPIYFGLQERRWAWCAQGVLWSALVVVGWATVIASGFDKHSSGRWLILAGWGGAALSGFAIKRATGGRGPV